MEVISKFIDNNKKVFKRKFFFDKKETKKITNTKILGYAYKML